MVQQQVAATTELSGILKTKMSVHLRHPKNSEYFRCSDQFVDADGNAYTFGIIQCDGSYLTLNLKCERCAEGSATKSTIHRDLYDREAVEWLKNKSSSRRNEKKDFIWIARTDGAYIADAENDRILFVSPSGDVLGELRIDPKTRITSYAELDTFSKQFCK